jgi:hypothetical protein
VVELWVRNSDNLRRRKTYDCSVFTLSNLNADKDNDQQPKPNKEPDDFRIVPRKRGTAPLERQQQAHDSRDEDPSPEKIHFPQSVPYIQRS